MFGDFDFTILGDPEFKEDSVREELVVPTLKRLGYTATGDHRIVRGRPLEHPFVSLGSKPHKVNLFPDYLLAPSKAVGWVLDAKAPDEEILKGPNVEQAYSYAIHPEVRVPIYALCNGRKLAVFHVSRLEPDLVVDVPEIDKRWDEVNNLLNPVALTDPALFHVKPDLGLTLHQTDMGDDTIFTFPAQEVNVFTREEDDLYSLTGMVTLDRAYCVTFDLDAAQYEQMLSQLPPEKAATVRDGLKRYPYQAIFRKNSPQVTVGAVYGKRIVNKAKESFLPLRVVEVGVPGA